MKSKQRSKQKVNIGVDKKLTKSKQKVRKEVKKESKQRSKQEVNKIFLMGYPGCVFCRVVYCRAELNNVECDTSRSQDHAKFQAPPKIFHFLYYFYYSYNA